MIAPSRRLIVAAAAAAAVSSAAPRIASAVLPTITFDLRVHDTGGKDASVSHAGQAVLIDLYAQLSGIDSDPTNDELGIATGSIRSSNGGLLGNLLGLRPPTPFNANGYSVGTQADLDGDGDLDVGGTGTSATPYYAVRQAPPYSLQPSGGYFFGQVQFTAGTIADLSTQISYLLRPTVTTGTLLTSVDGSSLTNDPTKMNVVYAAPVTIHGVTNPGGADQYLNGTVSTHQSIINNTQVSPGQTLLLTTGFDVQPTGTLDTSAGYSSATINDTTSGNFGGTLVFDGITIGSAADGAFTQAGGSSHVGGIVVGGGGHAAQLLISGGTLNGGAASAAAGGSIRQTGGSASFASLAAGGGSVEVAAGDLTISGDTTISGTPAAPAFVQSGGKTTASDVYVGGDAISGGAAGVQGGTLNTSNLLVGGVGQVVQSNGAVVGNDHVRVNSVGPAAGGAGYQIGGGTLSGGFIYLGSVAAVNQPSRSGTLAQTGGTVSTNFGLYIGTDSGYTARYDLSGGTLTGSALRVGNVLKPGAVLTTDMATLAQSGGDVNTPDAKVDQTGVWRVSGGTVTIGKKMVINGTFDLAGAAVPVTFGTNCFADFTKGHLVGAQNSTWTAGPGSILNFAAGFDPLTQIGSLSTQGLVHVDGQALVIPASQTVGGSGEISGDVTNNGTVAPGNSPGEIDVTGNYTQSATAALDIELAGTTPDKFDLLTVSGSAGLNGSLSVSLLDGFVPSSSDQFTFLTAGNVSGIFANAADHIDLPGGRFSVLYLPTSVTLTNFQAVPEPASAGLLAVAAVGLIRRRRRA